ncbi:MAG: hypothetical protein HY705_10280 [Gemmatimonadetes bacterium]|nr:hypothetical protein [Gemmatimonadota bacterium]
MVHARLIPAVLAATLVLAADTGCRSERGEPPADTLASRPRTESVTGTPPSGPIQEADFSVAAVALGTDSARVVAALGRPESVEVRGHPFDSAGLRVWHYRDVIVEIAGSVERITLRSPAVTTARGVRVGDVTERVRAAYGESVVRTPTSWKYSDDDDPSGLPPAVEFRMEGNRVAAVTLGLSGYDSPPPPWQWARPPWFISGEGIGPISRSTSEEELLDRFGPEEVARDTIYLGEGEWAVGTVLFPGDSLREIEIEWEDADARRSPLVITLRGTAAVWRTREGVTLGRSLRDLEALNGRPFELAGWGWDYGGSDCSWGGGRLAAPLANVRLGFSEAGLSDLPDAEQHVLSGDSCRSSAMRPMQRLNPVVVEIRIVFGR